MKRLFRPNSYRLLLQSWGAAAATAVYSTLLWHRSRSTETLAFSQRSPVRLKPISSVRNYRPARWVLSSGCSSNDRSEEAHRTNRFTFTNRAKRDLASAAADVFAPSDVGKPKIPICDDGEQHWRFRRSFKRDWAQRCPEPAFSRQKVLVLPHPTPSNMWKYTVPLALPLSFTRPALPFVGRSVPLPPLFLLPPSPLFPCSLQKAPSGPISSQCFFHLRKC